MPAHRKVVLATSLSVLALICAAGFAPIAAADYPAPGAQKVAVIPVNFNGDRYASSAALDTARQRMFTGADSVDAFWRQVSNDTIWLTGQLDPEGDVFPWQELNASAGTCDQDAIEAEAKAKIQAAYPGVNVAEYDNVVLLATPDASACPVAGSFEKSRFFAKPSSTTFQYIHEFGHTMTGNGHANLWRCNAGAQVVATDANGTCRSSDYGDDLDVMGTKTHLFSGLLRARLGLIPATNVTVSSDFGDYTIKPINDTLGPGNTQLLRIPRAGSQYYFLDFRREASGPFDTDFGVEPVSTGPVIRWVNVDSGVLGTPLEQASVIRPTPNSQSNEFSTGQFGDTSTWGASQDYLGSARSKHAFLRPGRTFYDPSADISITTLSADPSATSIRYEAGSPGATSIVSVSDRKLTFAAGANQSNDVGVSIVGGNYVVVDNGGPLAAGAGCATTSSSARVTCPISDVDALDIDLGDRDDGVQIYDDVPATIRGGDGNDVLIGSDSADVMLSGAGDDLINPRAGENSIDYSDRSATVTATLRESGIIGGVGSEQDRLIATATTRISRLVGGSGNDVLGNVCGANPHAIDGGAGADQITGAACDEVISGGAGNDTLQGGGGQDTFHGEDGDDQINSRDADADVVTCGEGVDSVLADQFDGDFADCDFVDPNAATAVSTAFGILLVNAAPSTQNRLSVVQSDGVIIVAEDSLPVSAGLGCEDGGGTAVVCSSAGVMSLDISLGDGGDQLQIDSPLGAVVAAGDGDDTVSGGAGDDHLSGGSGNDILTRNLGSDDLSGDDGDDHASTRDLAADNVECGAGADSVAGDEFDEANEFDCEFRALSGRTLLSAGWQDLLFEARSESVNTIAVSPSGTGLSVVDSTAGVDASGSVCSQVSLTEAYCPFASRASGVMGDRDDSYVTSAPLGGSVNGGDGDDQFVGGDDQDSFYGEAGNDHFTGNGGANVLFGGGGNDAFDQGTVVAPEILIGGDGSDTVVYAQRLNPVFVELDNQLNDGEVGEGDRDSDIEIVIGGSGADEISAPVSGAWVSGGPGDDILTGAVGSQSLFGAAGNDTITPGEGNDVASGDDGDDQIFTQYVNYDTPDVDSVMCGAGQDSVRGDETDQIDPFLCEQVEKRTATTVEISDRVLTVAAGPGQDNQLVVRDVPGSDNYRIDGGNQKVSPGAGCVADGNRAALCPRAAADTGELLGGDGEDNLIQDSSLQMNVYGGAGDDRLFATSTAGTELFGGEGADELSGISAGHLMDGGDGDDTFFARNGVADTLECAAGEDFAVIDTRSFDHVPETCEHVDERPQTTVNSRAQENRLTISAAPGLENEIAVAPGPDGLVTVSDGAQEIDAINCASSTAHSAVCNPRAQIGVGLDPSSFGSDGGNTFESTVSTPTEVFGALEADDVTLGSGNDLAWLYNGDDVVDGGAGNDALVTGNGNDTITGGPGQDTISADTHQDTVFAVDGEVDSVDCGDQLDTAYVDLADDVPNCEILIYPDTTPPETSITSEPSSPTTESSLTWGFGSSESPSTFECKLEAGSAPGAAAFSSCSGPGASHTSATLSNGTYTFSVRATDEAQNVDPSPATSTIVIEAPVPELTLTYPSEGGYTASATFGWSISSGVAPYTVRCALNGGTPEICSQWTPVGYLADGTHTAVITATDANGNSASVTRSFIIDTTRPQVTITSPTGTINQANPLIEFNATATSGISQRLCIMDNDWGGLLTCASGFVWPTALSDGPHRLTIRAISGAGLPTDQDIDFIVDTQAPSLTIDAPAQGQLLNAAAVGGTRSVSLAFSAGADSVETTCRIDSGALVSPCASPRAFTSVADGTHSFTVTVRDAAGNTRTASRDFTVDATAPDTRIDSGPAQSSTTDDQTPTFAFRGVPASETTGFECQIDGGAFTSCGSGGVGSTTLANLSAGSHQFAVRATDTAGNQDTTAESRTFTVSAPGLLYPGTKVAQPNATPISLSAAGPAGWAHWGTGTAAATEAQLLVPTRKSGTTSAMIGDATRLGTVATTRVTSGIPQSTWNGVGDPTGSPTTTAIRVGANSVTSGFSVTMAAPMNVARTAKLYLGALSTTGKLVATISDGSATSVTDTAVVTAGSTAATVMVPLTFRATSPGATVTIQYTQNVASSSGRVYLESIALVDSADSSPPDTTITSGVAEDGVVSSSTTSFSFSSTEPTSGSFQCKLDSGNWSVCSSGSYTSGSLARGSHSFRVRAIDSAGNVDPQPASRNFWIAPPVAMLSAGAKTALPVGTPINLTAAGPAGWAHWGTGTSTTESNLLNPTRRSGTTASVIANATRLGSVTTTRVSTGIPQTTWNGAGDPSGSPTTTGIQAGSNAITSGFSVVIAAPSTTSRIVKLYLGALNTTGKLTVSLSDGSAPTLTDTAVVTATSPAANVMVPITLRAASSGATATITYTQNVANTAGRVYLESIALEDGADTSAPSTSFTSGPANGSVIAGNAATFGFTASEPGSTLRCSIDLGAFNVCASPFTTPALSAGKHTLDVFAADAAGNVEGRPPRRTFYVE